MEITAYNNKNIWKYRSWSEELNGIIVFAIRDIFHAQKTFFLKFPIEIAGMIELGKKNSWSDRIRKETEREKNRVALFPTVTTH